MHGQKNIQAAGPGWLKSGGERQEQVRYGGSGAASSVPADAEEDDGGSWVLWNGRCGWGGPRLVRCLMRNDTSQDRRGAARELARIRGVGHALLDRLARSFGRDSELLHGGRVAAEWDAASPR